LSHHQLRASATRRAAWYGQGYHQRRSLARANVVTRKVGDFLSRIVSLVLQCIHDDGRQQVRLSRKFICWKTGYVYFAARSNSLYGNRG